MPSFSLITEQIFQNPTQNPDFEVNEIDEIDIIWNNLGKIQLIFVELKTFCTFWAFKLTIRA